MTLDASHNQVPGAHNILVIRFGSLGDLCVLGWALARLTDLPGGDQPRVTLVTKAAFAPLMDNVRGIHEVIPLTGSGMSELAQLARKLRRRNWDRIIDAHNILRGHLLLGMMRRRADRRLAKDTAARLAFMRFGKRSAELDQTMHDRFAALVADPSRTHESSGTILPPLASLASGPRQDVQSPHLGLAPGAQWDPKRWPEEFFTTLLEQWLEEHSSGRASIFLGPREEAWFSGSALDRFARQNGRTDVVSGLSIPEVAAQLSRCTRLVTNDSGLLHVAEAVGTPVLAFFGPTVREFGYFPILPESLVLESSLDCRPCSRNGKRPCHRGDLACLRDIKPEAALSVLSSMDGTS
jgi:heptosyltransferase-2